MGNPIRDNKACFSLSPFEPENLVSRERLGRVSKRSLRLLSKITQGSFVVSNCPSSKRTCTTSSASPNNRADKDWNK